MPLNLLVYDPPIVGFPYLAVAVETDAPAEALYTEAHPTLAAAEAAIIRMAARLEREEQEQGSSAQSPAGAEMGGVEREPPHTPR